MTDNQPQTVFDLLTKCINGIQDLREGQDSLEQDVSELKAGQKRIEKEVRLNTLAVNEIMSEHFRLKVRVDEMGKLAA